MPNQSLRTNEDAAEVVDTYANMVYRLAFAQVGNVSDAEDVFQEVFLRYIRRSRTFESEEHRKAWLIRVTVNCAKDHFRLMAKQKNLPLTDIPFEQPEESLLHEAMQTLPPAYRAVIHLFYYEDFPVERIAKTLHVSPAAVRMRLHRARAMLEKTLKGWER